MTENKRFKLHIKWYNIEKTEGEATLTDYGQPLIETEQITDARLLKNILNDLYNENEQLKSKIKRLQYDLEHKQNHLNQLLKKPVLTDILPQAHDILRINTELEEENEQLKDDVYNEIDNVLTVLKELYEDIPLNSQKKINQLYNRLESLRDDLND